MGHPTIPIKGGKWKGTGGKKRNQRLGVVRSEWKSVLLFVLLILPSIAGGGKALVSPDEAARWIHQTSRVGQEPNPG
ncbi:hypothetical protein BO78DRAFT_52075 [Aspergillus sclerotiicarbonarius CBS 121057]|uniref:Uncharacterized protein n=1 Tax=Aspergillus sclerotiicarbonarius (strain CBS 121057 / IBT 28362) TaxID=1448318 RepID=A0A319EQJ5_ASPSB|nr:hypothetical protein BO78DRAFT_52075 [Aspergillus sclerotiicarbonarius CBS 121057]